MCEIILELLAGFENGMNVTMKPFAVSIFSDLRFSLYCYEGDADRGFPKFYMDFDVISDENPHGVSCGSQEITDIGRLVAAKRGGIEVIKGDRELQRWAVAYVIEKSGILTNAPDVLEQKIGMLRAAKEAREIDEELGAPINRLNHRQRI